MDETCQQESSQLIKMQQAPQVFLEFIQNLTDELATTEDDNFDPNNDVAYTIANCILSSKPGFSKNQGYNVVLNILEDGTQEIVFLLTEIGLFDKKMIDPKTKFLTNSAKILEEFVLKNPDGSTMYEIVEIGNGMGRNIVKYDLDKIQRKANAFLDADVAGLMSSEQGVIAAWNVFIAKGTSAEEDAEMVQDANAWEQSWTYEDNLPLTQDHKEVFIQRYKEYFSKNYLYTFTENQLPYVQEDAAVFDIAQVKQKEAQKFLDDNDLN